MYKTHKVPNMPLAAAENKRPARFALFAVLLLFAVSTNAYAARTTACPACQYLVDQLNNFDAQLDKAREQIRGELVASLETKIKALEQKLADCELSCKNTWRHSPYTWHTTNCPDCQDKADKVNALEEERATAWTGKDALNAKVSAAMLDLQHCEVVMCPAKHSAVAPGGIKSQTGALNNAFSGFFAGAQFEGSSVTVSTNEYDSFNGMKTNQFKDSSSGFMGGVNAGFNWALSPQSFIGVVAEVNGGNSNVKRSFSGSPAFIESDANFQSSLLGRLGFLATPSDAVYVQGGPVFTNQNLQMNLGGVTTNSNQFTFGGAVGAGVEHKFGVSSGALKKWCAPSIFLEYRHIWAGEANLGQPAASPSYNYDWRRESDTVVTGIRVGF